MRNRVAKQEALWYEAALKDEITKDRAAHGKKPLKDRKDDNTLPSSSGRTSLSIKNAPTIKTQKCSTSDPDSGWFRKREHKHIFAYGVETACDKHGWILGYSIHPGNEHDSRTFITLYEKLKELHPKMIVADAGYKTPAIAMQLLRDGIQPLLPYKRPMTKDGFFKKSEYVYDEYFDAYICPGNQLIPYHTTNRDGYREYKSKNCEFLPQCTESKEHIKVIPQHVWDNYMEQVEDIRYGIGNKEIYAMRKETIERVFGTAKEHHGFRYTNYVGKARMEMKVGLTFACMNFKKIAKLRYNNIQNNCLFLCSEIKNLIKLKKVYYIEKCSWC